MFGIPEAYLGPVAGVATSVLWTATSLLFAAAGRRIGALLVNVLRIYLAVLCLGLVHFALEGVFVPDALPGQVLLLGLSGILGLSVGDWALFQALLDIGPRLSTLLMATAPLFAVFFGWLVLGEALSLFAWVGIFAVVGGVAWVVLERPARPEGGTLKRRGVLLGLFAAACQAGGLLLSKQGMGHGWLEREQYLSPVSAALFRMLFAALGVLPLLFFSRRRGKKDAPPRLLPERREGLILTLLGTIVGPFLGMWMSLVASDLAPLGIAQTLCSLTPIFILPCLVYLQKERISLRATMGAFLAVGGSVLLFLTPR